MTISFLVTVLAQILILALLASAILSWLPKVRALTPVTTLLNGITYPVLTPIRRWMPIFGGLDFSLMIAILLISGVETLALALLAGH